MQRITGLNSLTKLPELLLPYHHSRVLLVTGKASYVASGAQQVAETALKDMDVFHFNDFEINPKIEDAIRGADLARRKGVDLILAIGGGSVLDMAKLIKAFYANPDASESLAKGKTPVTDPDIPLIALPTTAGSGSEATHFAVVYIGSEKFSLAAPCLLPDHVILDGALLASATPYQKACNILDALAQAIESAWAVGSTNESRDIAFHAIDLITQHAHAMVRPDADPASLQGLSAAANLAGQAINISKTTAAHAWSYGITGQYGIPHGHAVWLTLPMIFQIHAQASDQQITDPRGPAHLHEIMARLMQTLSINRTDQCCAVLRGFMEDLTVQHDLEKLGANTVQKRDTLSQLANMQRMSNNPVRLNSQNIKDIFRI